MCDRWKWLKEDADLKGNLTTNDIMDLLDQLKELGPVDIGTYSMVCGQCGSYFFFKNVMDEITDLKNRCCVWIYGRNSGSCFEMDRLIGDH